MTYLSVEFITSYDLYVDVVNLLFLSYASLLLIIRKEIK